MPTPAETMANMENLIPQSARKPVDNDFTQLDNFTQEQIAKPKNNQQTQNNRIQADFNKIDELEPLSDDGIVEVQTEQEFPDYDNNSGYDSFSRLLNGLTQLLSSDNTEKLSNNPAAGIDKSSDSHKFYQIDPSQQGNVMHENESKTD